MYGGGVMPGRRRAGSDVAKYNAESPKQGSKRFNFIAWMIHFAHLGILFICGIALAKLIYFAPIGILLYCICFSSSPWVRKSCHSIGRYTRTLHFKILFSCYIFLIFTKKTLKLKLCNAAMFIVQPPNYQQQ